MGQALFKNFHLWAPILFIRKKVCNITQQQGVNLEKEYMVDKYEKGFSILKREVERAIKYIKKIKATGDDDISVDIVKELGVNGLRKLTNFIDRIYRRDNDSTTDHGVMQDM